MTQIEQSLLNNLPGSAFVLPEPIADIVHLPELIYSNGTPAFRIIPEHYRIIIKPTCLVLTLICKLCFSFLDVSTQFLLFHPLIMQDRFYALWQRMVESGINQYEQRQHFALYKAVRSEMFRLTQTYRQPLHENENMNNYDELPILLFHLVLGVGYAMALLAFAFELVCDYNKIK